MALFHTYRRAVTHGTVRLPEHGFIAFLSILIIGAVLLGLTLSLSEASITTRFELLTIEEKYVSEARAESCVHYARILILNDPTYTLDTPVVLPVGGDECSLLSVSDIDDTKQIRSEGRAGRAITNLVVHIDTESHAYVSWEEAPY